MKYNKLTPEEEKVILGKGTEPPHSGEYDMHFKKGIYTCRRCNLPLYKSSAKFNSGSGWPSFDQEIKGNVKRVPLKDDPAVEEVICRRCGAHLGHVFKGENFTPKNTRHCINSISLKFTPKDKSEK